MEQNKFNELTKSWLNMAENFAIKSELEAHISNNFELGYKIFEYLNPITSRFLTTAFGESIRYYDINLSYAININRLLKSKNLETINSQTSENLKNLIKETFSFGMLTQLYLLDFPTREKYSLVEISKLEKDWIVEAIIADVRMGYYGDRKNPICMNIWELHFQDFVSKLLKEEFNVNIFRMGKFKSYFRNLYLAGALLVMNCDMDTEMV